MLIHIGTVAIHRAKPPLVSVYHFSTSCYSSYMPDAFVTGSFGLRRMNQGDHCLESWVHTCCNILPLLIVSHHTSPAYLDILDGALWSVLNRECRQCGPSFTSAPVSDKRKKVWGDPKPILLIHIRMVAIHSAMVSIAPIYYSMIFSYSSFLNLC